MSLWLEVVTNGRLANMIQNHIARSAEELSSIFVQLTSKLSDSIQGGHIQSSLRTVSSRWCCYYKSFHSDFEWGSDEFPVFFVLIPSSEGSPAQNQRRIKSWHFPFVQTRICLQISFSTSGDGETVSGLAPYFPWGAGKSCLYVGSGPSLGEVDDTRPERKGGGRIGGAIGRGRRTSRCRHRHRRRRCCTNEPRGGRRVPRCAPQALV